MNKLLFIIVFVSTLCRTIFTEELDPDNAKKVIEGEKKISEYVKSILEHYKQEDPVGIPIAPIPDPMSVPPLTQSFAFGKMNMKNVELTGLSKFRIHHVITDLQSMRCEAALTIENLIVYGNYTLSTFLSKYEGPFSVKLKDVFVKGISRLEVQKYGQLEALDMDMDITVKNIDMHFEGFTGMFQGIINSVGSFVFTSIKPYVLKNVNSNLKKDVNKQLAKFPQNFTNSISPLDLILVEVRKKIRNMGYDPYKINDYNRTMGIVGIEMTDTLLSGLSTFHRDGNMTIEIRNNTVQATVAVASQRLKGTSNYEIFLAGKMLSRMGSVAFSVEYLKIEVVVSQSMDTRNPPTLDDIQLELGNIAVRCNGLSTLDYIVELVSNVLPNVLRYGIMDAVESPIKMRIQEELNAINVEKLIQDNLSALDEQQKTGFKGMLQ